ncbi:unnamed protein product [Prorocentrum cordatum]|uniref:Uncharacterized protein n=1 Tax=Prorocentrum cordatum TaxID=2364126 RepID=A0ABN9YBI8_9DINO|nr:unnamed protein product [Polarella glacialis]
MWIQSLISGYLQDSLEQDCTNSLPGMFYPGESPEEHALVSAPQGVMDPVTMWMCDAVIDPVGKGCTQLFNPQASCASVDDDTCRDLAIRNPKIYPEDPMSQQATITQAILNVPSFKEDMLYDACAFEVALLTIDSGPLKGEKLSGRCDHQVALIVCDHDADNYTMWTWVMRKYLTRAGIFEPRYSLQDAAQKLRLSEEDLPNYTSNASVLGGMFCTAILSDDITFATL